MTAQDNIDAHLLFAMLDEATRAQLCVEGKEVRYRPGQTIHRQGDHDRSLQVIIEGQVRFSRLDRDGRKVNAAVFGPGESFGELPLLTGRPRTHDAVAVGAVRLLRLSDRQFRDLLNRKPELRDRLLAELAERLVNAADRLDSALRLSVPQRVAQFLVAEVERGAGALSLHVRQSDIADALGVTREAVAAALRKFRAERLVETRYRAIDVLDLDALRLAVGRGAAG
ncbi:CRP-like cAMP-activated global transcriptional regulator [Paraburkholderia caffeinitolerans]|uniref:CRP-like cAMP-activated global transcriptional regulator n=1 Tax=Paraburkholderia caffeinitolerans TaxID=1723730 RepID=A0A6J5FFC1_9BURK|nr:MULTISPECIES: Crp/Fnr family transcriptional regulator [Paraburkholderia]CAB3778368.1 CRP-like cAMP-activated global transcriptional regulator [Paraburkholderia caffeinitolerans]